jgi:hypothetical protein
LNAKRDVAGDKQQVAGWDVDEVLVQVGCADDPGHRALLNMASIRRGDWRNAGSNP